MTRLAVADLNPTERYKLTTGLVIPRPIGWIGTYGPTGTPNLAPYSFFQAVATNPPVLVFSAGVTSGVIKDSLANVRSSGVFTASLVDHDLGPAMNESAAEVAEDVDEFELAGLTAIDYGAVAAPAVAEAKAVMECRVINEIVLGEEPVKQVVTFGEVVAFHVRDDVLDGTRINASVLDALGRLAGNSYASTRDHIELARPK